VTAGTTAGAPAAAAAASGWPESPYAPFVPESNGHADGAPAYDETNPYEPFGTNARDDPYAPFEER
jgi:hypothetical protein